ncbi:MAG TPA: glutathione S-transferase family protein [Labilithrix sp.]
MKYELVSHPLCPFVHRSATLLREKGVPYAMRFVDLEHKPDWFRAMSPRGKVPLLVVDGTVLFESAIINEYLDETIPPRLMPDGALERARTRAWAEVANDLFAQQYRLLVGPTEHDWNEGREKCDAIFERLEKEIRGEYFFGDAFGLVDVAFAPALYRFTIVERATGTEMLVGFPKVDAWSRRVAERASVKSSVVADFEDRYLTSIRQRGGWLARLVA